jgi:hypothetical protein
MILDCYMVVLRCSWDDIPVLITDIKAEAENFAEAFSLDCGELKHAERVLNINHTDINNLSIFTFENGKLWDVRVVKDYDLDEMFEDSKVDTRPGEIGGGYE